MEELIGLKRGTLALVPHRAEWEAIFREEKARLLSGLGARVTAVEHVGSTAIPGLVAKPIIDIIVALKRFEDGFRCVPFMESLGYCFLGEYGIPGRHYFRTNSEIVKFHVHMFQKDDPAVWRHLAFRDYLLARPETAAEYAALKMKLKETCGDDAQKYTDGKAGFINHIVARATDAAKA
jgi:GrpB-like predicted nucleotidyltransferase (UPF0157 family)